MTRATPLFPTYRVDPVDLRPGDAVILAGDGPVLIETVEESTDHVRVWAERVDGCVVIRRVPAPVVLLSREGA